MIEKWMKEQIRINIERYSNTLEKSSFVFIKNKMLIINEEK